MQAVLLISHGSHSPRTKQEVSDLVQVLKRSCQVPILEYAFLEIEKPSIPDGIDIYVKKGARTCLILLNFLNSGRHVDEDIPQIIDQAKLKYPLIRFQVSPPVGQHPRITELFLDLLKQIN